MHALKFCKVINKDVKFHVFIVMFMIFLTMPFGRCIIGELVVDVLLDYCETIFVFKDADKSGREMV